MADVYRTDPPEAHACMPLEEMSLVYHRPSGQTHLLAEPAHALIEALAPGPADLPTLMLRLARTHAVPGDGVTRARITERLAELEASGLVTRA